jgi:hypothetical protein
MGSRPVIEPAFQLEKDEPLAHEDRLHDDQSLYELQKTLRDGRYKYSEVQAGRIRITVIVDNKPVLSYRGDDILVVEGGVTVADFDLSKPPAN